MSVTLDNIQFYNGPSEPAKQPNFAFNSKKHGSGTLPSFHLPAIENRSIYGFHPATHLEGTIEQQTDHPSNLFDLEIAKSWEMVSSLGERGACRWKPSPDGHHPENVRSPSRDLCKSIEPAFPGRVSRSSSISPSPSLLHMNSEEDPLPKSTDVIQEFSTSCSPSSGGTFDICTPCDEDGSSSSFSSISSQPGLNYRAASEGSTPYVPESSLSDCPADPHQQSLDFTSRSVGVLGSVGPDAHVGISYLRDQEQATRCGSADSYSEPTGFLKGATQMRKPMKESDESSSRKRGDTNTHTSIAVEIPPPRRYYLRRRRSSPEHITSDESQSESSSDSDDFDDEDFPFDTVAPRVSDAEGQQSSTGENSRPIQSSSCSLANTSHQSTCQYMKNDIIGRAVLTIEKLGPESTYFLTFMPDKVGWVPPVSMCNSRTSERPTKVSKGVNRSYVAPVKERHRSYSTDEDLLLVELKEQKNLTWKEIARHFPRRTSSSLQVHYSTKLKPRKSSRRNRQGRKRAKRGKHG